MKDPKQMSNEQLYHWMEKSVRTCQRIFDRYPDGEAAQNHRRWDGAYWRFHECMYEFSARGLNTKDFSEHGYDYEGHELENNFFWDSMA